MYSMTSGLLDISKNIANRIMKFIIAIQKGQRTTMINEGFIFQRKGQIFFS